MSMDTNEHGLTRESRDPRHARERFAPFDYLRGLAVIFMVMVHVLNMYASPNLMDTTWAVIVDFMGGTPAAPVFMILMGVFFVQSRQTSLLTNLRRGLGLLVTGYLLNIFRGVLPVYLGRDVLGLPMRIPEMFTYPYLFLEVDILIFAGLAYMLMALIRHITDDVRIWLVLAGLFAAAAPFLWGLGEDIPVFGRILQPLWSADTDLATFPLFPWMWFPMVGMVIGSGWAAGIDRRRLGRFVLIAAIALFCIGLVLVLVDMDRFYHDYGQMGIGGILGITGIALLWSLGIIALSPILERFLRTGFLTFISRNLTSFYVVHWLILGWLLLVIPADSQDFGGWTALSVGILGITSLLLRRRR